MTTEGDGSKLIAAENFTGSIPTSCGVAVCQLAPGNPVVLVCGTKAAAVGTAGWIGCAGITCGEVSASAGEATRPAIQRNITIKTARSRGDRLVLWIEFGGQRQCLRNSFFPNIN